MKGQLEHKPGLECGRKTLLGTQGESQKNKKDQNKNKLNKCIKLSLRVEIVPFSFLQKPPSLAKGLIHTFELTQSDQSNTLCDKRVLKTTIKGSCPEFSIP